MADFLKNLFSGKGKAKDPVCGMTVSPEHAAFTTSYQGTMYYFCSESCKRQFDGDPGTFVKKRHS